jgi:hypothetical protein
MGSKFFILIAFSITSDIFKLHFNYISSMTSLFERFKYMGWELKKKMTYRISYVLGRTHVYYGHMPK